MVTLALRAQLLVAAHAVDILNHVHREGALRVRYDRRRPLPSAHVLDTDAARFQVLAGGVNPTLSSAVHLLVSWRLRLRLLFSPPAA